MSKKKWRVGRPTEHGTFNPCRIEEEDETGVCEVYGISLHTTLEKCGPRDKAGLENAYLIAAAPDLLAALKTTRDALRYALLNNGETPLHSQVVKMADLAIAKAEGPQS